MLDVHRLRVFRSVVASGSIHAAASNLGYTPSAISQHMTALQREVGLTLLTRAGRGIEPTEAGRIVAREIDNVLSRLGSLETLVGQLRAGRSGRLSIAYIPSVSMAWMPTVVRGLLRSFPDIQLDLSLRDELTTGADPRPDLQIIVAQSGQQALPGSQLHHLLDDPYVAVIPVDHPLATAGQVELAQLSGERWVDNDTTDGWCRRNLIESCRAAGFSPAFQVETHDYATAIAFVNAGVGLTVLPRLAARNPPAGVTVVPVTRPTPQRTLYAVVQTAVASEPSVRTAMNLLRQCAGADGDTDAGVTADRDAPASHPDAARSQ